METLETINRRLVDYFGKTGDNPTFRIVWSNDQIEKRRISVVNGVELLFPEVREVKKYFDNEGWFKDKYILEKYTLVPPGVETDLVEPFSYEPVWTFDDVAGNPIQPSWGAAKFVIDQMLIKIGHMSPPVKDPRSDPEKEQERMEQLEKELWGNSDSSRVLDALSHDSAVGYGSRNRSRS